MPGFVLHLPTSAVSELWPVTRKFFEMPEILELTCGPLVAGGACLVRRPGEKTVFVEGGIPGEMVRATVRETRKDLVNAVVTEVIEPSEHRVEPRVLLPSEAGGAEWQHIAPDAQHDFKIDIARDALTRIAKLESPIVNKGGAVSDTGYRTTVRLGVLNTKSAVRTKRSHDLVPIQSYEILHPRLQELLTCKFGEASEVTLRCSDSSGERLAWLRGDPTSVTIPSDVQLTVNGRNASFTEHLLGRDWLVSAPSFFQSGPQAAIMLAEHVNNVIPEDIGWVVDAYSGVGLLGGVVAAERSCRLTSVEQSRSAVRDARENLRDLAADIVESEVAEIALQGETVPDAVIADPARTGLGKSASRALCGIGASLLVLVSCDPASLARDVLLLLEGGYELEQTTVLDLFPHTPQLEAVSVFRKIT